jgi:hypothetical protein
LIIVAILALFSASSTLAFEKNSSPLGPIMEQILFVAAGVGLAFVRFLHVLFIYFLLSTKSRKTFSLGNLIF